MVKNCHIVKKGWSHLTSPKLLLYKSNIFQIEQEFIQIG